MRSTAVVAVALLALAMTVSAADVLELGERNADGGAIKKASDVLGRKPTLVFFYSPRCAHSRGFMPEFDAAAAESDSSVTFARVDVDRWDELKDKYRVSRVPDIRFCTANADSECTPYPEYSPNTKAGVLEYLSGRTGSRFAQSHSDVDVAALSDSEKAAILATKGTCEVASHASEELLGEDEDVAEEEESADASFDAEEETAADAFVELEDEAEAEVEAELEAEDEEEAGAEDEEEAEEATEDEAAAEEEADEQDELEAEDEAVEESADA